MATDRSKWRTQDCRTAFDRDRGPVSERQDQPSRRPSGARRRRGAAGLGARGHQRRRLQPRSARPRDERRAQYRQRRLHGRPLHLLRLPRLGRVLHDMRFALPVCDAAVVVCEADPRKVPALQVILRELEELGVPAHSRFSTRSTSPAAGVRETLEMLQPASRTPLLLRQIPIWENGVATGFVDLALERAFVYRESAPSDRGRDAGRRRSATKSRRAIRCSSGSPTTTTR